MLIMVNGKEKELTAKGIHGVEYTRDLFGGSVEYDEEQGEYVMSEEDFAWWNRIVNMMNEIHDLEEELDEDDLLAYQNECFGCDLESETEGKLEWLKSCVKQKKHC